MINFTHQYKYHLPQSKNHISRLAIQRKSSKKLTKENRKFLISLGYTVLV